MKKYFITFILLLFSVAVFSQEIMKNKDYYAAKAKRQRSGGRVMLIGGAALVGGGFLIGNCNDSTFDDAATGVVMGALGIGLMIGSIPMFTAAERNKKKSITLAIKTQLYSPVQNVYVIYYKVPSIAIKISL